jgi:hypothetical protein
VSCANRAGSQKLIDKRRKMKDTKGAEYAMQISKEVWEQQPRVAPITKSKPPVIASSEAVMNRPITQPRTDMVGPSSRFHTTRPVQLGPPTMGNVGFSPMDHHDNDEHQDNKNGHIECTIDQRDVDLPITTPTLSNAPTTALAAPIRKESPTDSLATNYSLVAVTDSVNKTSITSSREHHETPAGVRRLSFDGTVATASARKKQKHCHDDDTTSVPYFGHDVAPLSSSIMTNIFQFVSESDLVSTSQVCDLWKLFQNHQYTKKGDTTT